MSEEAVLKGRTPNPVGSIALHDHILSAHWWDEVFEAADLMKFVNNKLPGCGGQDNKDDCCTHCDADVEGRDSCSACAVPTISSLSSTSSASTHHQSAVVGPTIIYPSRLKILAAKNALNSGKEHVSTLGRVRKARCLKNPCHSNCNRCQLPRLTKAERLFVLERFWSLNSHEKQWTFIFNAVSVSQPKRKMAIQGSKGAKSCSREYYLPIRGKKKKVCKTMFKHTLSICDSWIDSALSHAPMKTPDLRGKSKR